MAGLLPQYSNPNDVFRDNAKLDPSQVVDERGNAPYVAPKPMTQQANLPAHKIPKIPRKNVPNPHNIHK